MILPATLIDGLDSGVVALAADGRIEVWNAWIATRSGVAAADAVGRPLVEVFPGLAGSHLLTAVERALGNGLSTVMSHNLHPRVLPLFTSHGGAREPVEQSVVVRPVGGEGGRKGCLIQVSDITAAVRRDRHLRDVTVYNRTLFEMAVDAMVTVTPDGLLVDANPAFEFVSGLPRQTLAGTRFAELFVKPAEAERLIATAVAEGRARDVLLSIRRGNGSLRHVSLSAATVPSRRDDGTVVFLVARDQTEQIEAARELAKKTRIIERSNAELEQFAYVVSHDLRQPLRTVNSFLSLIERRLGDDIDAELKEFIDFAIGGAKRMDRLIVDLLNYSRVGRQGAPFEDVGLGAVLNEALANLSTVVGEAGAEVTVSAPLPTILGCRSELLRLFQNLVANAIHYAAPDRRPQIEIACRDDGANWVISVRDNGIGIPADSLERVFGLFQRLGTATHTDGSGIGLAVCRKIVDRHRGRIWAESDGVTGSAFFLSLPKQ
ncbi:MAG: sensor histidine kinase [Bacteroidales bacterium]